MNDFEMLEEAGKISFCLVWKTFLSWAFAYLANLSHEPFPEMWQEHLFLPGFVLVEEFELSSYLSFPPFSCLYLPPHLTLSLISLWLMLIEGSSKIKTRGPNIKAEKCISPPPFFLWRRGLMCSHIDPALHSAHGNSAWFLIFSIHLGSYLCSSACPAQCPPYNGCSIAAQKWANRVNQCMHRSLNKWASQHKGTATLCIFPHLQGSSQHSSYREISSRDLLGRTKSLVTPSQMSLGE